MIHERSQDDLDHLAAIIDSSEDAILSKSIDGIILTWNRGAEKLYGYTASEALGRHIDLLTPAEKKDEIPYLLERIRKNERIEHYEALRKRKDGTLITVSLTLSPIHNSSGAIIGASAIARNISTQKSIQRERDLLASIVESSNDAILSKNMDAIITSWNRGAQQLYGYTAGDVIGKHVSMLLPPGRPEEIPRIMERLKGGERIEQYETIRRKKDGSLMEVSLTISPVRDEDGLIIGASAIARDITMQKRLQLERNLLASIVENSDDAILSKLLDGTITSWNRGAEQLYGYSAAEVVGKPVSILVPNDQPDEIPTILRKLRQGDSIGHYETRRRKKDGSVIFVSLTISPVRDSNGTVIGASAVARDITQSKTADAMIRQQLREKNVLIQEVYHRVKNNLQLVTSLLELQSRQIQDEHTRGAFQDSIARIRAMALVHEKIFYSESISELEFSGYISSLFKPLVAAYSRSRIVNLAISGDTCVLELNTAIPLGMIMNELITNSLKYAFVATPSPTIEVSIRVDGDNASMKLADNGVGLPETVEFETSNTFGFRIVRLLAQQINADITVRRENGTCFEINVPLGRDRLETTT